MLRYFVRRAVDYRRHHQPLARAVARAVTGSDALVEDACAFAWSQLLRTQPERGRWLFGWLRTVAVHEAYRLSRAERREARLEELAQPPDHDGGSVDGWEALVPTERTLDEAVEACHALRTLADLPERQRRYFELLVAGYRYQEIVELTGTTYTNVNKHLTRARATVREAHAAA